MLRECYQEVESSVPSGAGPVTVRAEGPAVGKSRENPGVAGWNPFPEPACFSELLGEQEDGKRKLQNEAG